MKPFRILKINISVAVLIIFFTGYSLPGSLDPPNDAVNPQTAQPKATMHTLEEIYTKLNELVTAPVAASGLKVSSIPGDDGALQLGVPWPDPRFTDENNGTIIDNLTGLIWDKNAARFGTLSFAEGCSRCEELADNGGDLRDGSKPGDWRLANIRELTSMIDYGRWGPALPLNHPFAIVTAQGHFWSSNSLASDPTHAYTMNLYQGKIHLQFKVNGCWIWCVRDAR
jgi:hypothetical protein